MGLRLRGRRVDQRRTVPLLGKSCFGHYEYETFLNCSSVGDRTISNSYQMVTDMKDDVCVTEGH